MSSAVLIDTTAKRFTDTTGLPGSVLTVVGWFRLVATAGTTSIWQFSSGSSYVTLGLDTADLYLRTTNGSTFPTIAYTRISVGQWYGCGCAVNGASGRMILMTSPTGTVSSWTGTSFNGPATPTALTIGGRASGGNSAANADHAAWKAWSAELTQAEMVTELGSYAPIRTAGLLRAHFHPDQHPLPADYSGNGWTLSGGTGATVVSGPPGVDPGSASQEVELGQVPATLGLSGGGLDPSKIATGQSAATLGLSGGGEVSPKETITAVGHVELGLSGGGLDPSKIATGSGTAEVGLFGLGRIFMPPPAFVPLDGLGPLGTAAEFEWAIHVRRNADLARVAQVEDYAEAEFIPRFNDVGSWSLTLDRRQGVAALLSDPAYGVEVVRDGVSVFSGPVRAFVHTRDRSSSRLVVTGPDDMTWLARRRAHPQPATATPPYSAAEFDVRTGQAGAVMRAYVNVNAGPAAILPRRVPGLVIGDPVPAGSTVTGRARWEPLIEVLQGLALNGGGIGFRVLQIDGALVFDVHQPVDRSTTVRFAEEMQNLEGYRYERAGPEVNYVYLGGAGEGTLRVIRENQISASVLDWGRAEDFVDARSLEDPDEMTQASFEVLTDRGETTGLSITPVDVPGQAFGEHYRLGDRVSVVVDGGTVQELIREVRIRLSPDDGPVTVTPQIGTPGRTSVLALFDGFKRLRRRVTNMERR